LDFGELAVYDLYPNPLPDLFAGSQIVVVGRYREGGTTDIALQGKVNELTQTYIFPNQSFATNTLTSFQHSFIPHLWATRKIGYLLNQIRLQGPEQELVDQIVALSIRYGIVTPFTSYLVTEPMPLGVAEQERIANEIYTEMKSAPAAPSFGQDAVEQAAGEGALRKADTVGVSNTDTANLVRNFGARSYVFLDGVWLDTQFDPGEMDTVKVAFLSDDYFALAAADFQLAGAFSLGERVIAISDGIVYEVVNGSTPVPEIVIPEDEDPTITTDLAPTSEAVVLQQDVIDQTVSEPKSTNKGSIWPCAAGMMPLAIIPILSLVIARKH
jgi:Ca-activated chloride channel family protein